MSEESHEKDFTKSDMKQDVNDHDVNEGMELSLEAKLANDEEHAMSTWEAIKTYPMAIMWASVFATSLIMVGYDSGILYTFYALPAFTKKYGTYYGADIGYEVSAKWQNVLGMGTPVGQFLGAFTASWPMERWGRKKVFACSLFFTTAFVFLQMFAQDIHTLAAGEFMAGILYGTYVVLAPTYASEVCPVALRGILNAGMNLAYVIGQFISSGVGDGVALWTTQWAYRVPFAIQWVWPPVLVVFLWFAPESPWWLVRQERYEEAENSLRRLVRSSANINIKAKLANMQATTKHEAEMEEDTSYIECFRNTNRIRTEVAMMVQVWQVITGISLIGYAVYFFELAGLPVSASFDMGVGNTAIGFVATCSSWFMMAYFGRRTLFMTGVGIMAITQIIIGILDCIPNYDSHPGLAWAQAGFLDLLTFVFQSTVGPINFVIFSEIGSTRLRSQTCALATSTGSIFQIVMTISVPYMLNASSANWRGKTGFFFGGLSLLATIWCWFRLPETKGRTYDEMDYMFESKVPIRQFKTYKVETIEGQNVKQTV
ncbi:general substrate transporter [Talaromyces proteolyticus]|uniref:General substrate transporter n=1 Tax=Talaromyces proteolyticus TaxID=1131652 RepID=A0AAD4KZS7_9EURO|nr:general substrate transporter [Talaromyces proteolyticus]KAH8703619.1 general substrate transporter [Talaromyces proteolyticus]